MESVFLSSVIRLPELDPSSICVSSTQDRTGIELPPPNAPVFAPLRNPQVPIVGDQVASLLMRIQDLEAVSPAPNPQVPRSLLRILPAKGIRGREGFFAVHSKPATELAGERRNNRDETGYRFPNKKGQQLFTLI